MRLDCSQYGEGPGMNGAGTRIIRGGLLAVGLVVVAIAGWLGAAVSNYGPEYVRRVLVWQESDQGDYSNHFPQRRLSASPQPVPFAPAPDQSAPEKFAAAFGLDDLSGFLSRTRTEALLVIRNDRLVWESYGAGATRNSLLTSFSVAKSFVSMLIGIAIGEGKIASVDDPVTKYLPELAARDDRFSAITIRDLLTMSSGLDYAERRWGLFGGDDPLTTYYPDQRWISLNNTHIVRPPGEVFSYNKYHPQLLGMILERTTGMSVTQYTQTKLWDPLGMEFDGSWSLDSEKSGFEKMEAGLNARAVDFAKFGRLFLDGGRVGGVQVVSEAWMQAATARDPALQRADYYPQGWPQTIYAGGHGFYGFFVYGRSRSGASADFFAEGDHGQFIYISPAKRLVIVRLGLEFGIPSGQWVDGFYAFASAM